MEFAHKGLPFSPAALAAVCDRLNVGPAEVWAVLKVETRGFGYLTDRRPVILFERHIFHRLTDGVFSFTHPDISMAERGGYGGWAKEYPRLEQAMTLHRGAALKSASWGLGQIMGFNHDIVGYDRVEDMVADFVLSEDAQLEAVGRFIAGNAQCLHGIKTRDWEAFAACYNGPKFKENAYDSKLEAAFSVFSKTLPDLRVRRAQVALSYLGIDPGPIDGQLGWLTSGALTAFQTQTGLLVGGDLDDETEAALTTAAF